MKQIGVSLSLVALCVCFCCYAQQHGKTTSPAQAGGAGQQKLICPGSKSQLPYLHFVSVGFQDKVGGYWFATSEGVYHYDGQSFVNYEQMDGLNIVSRNGMAGDVVENIVEDKSGNIWFCTGYWAIRYNGKTFSRLEIPYTNAFNFKTFDGFGYSEGNYYNEKLRTSIFSDRSGNIWLFSGFDVYRFNETSGSFEKTGIGDYVKGKLMRSDMVDKGGYLCGAYQDRKGNVWFTTRGSSPFVQSFRLFGSRVDHPCVLNTCKHQLGNPNDLAAHNKEIHASLFTNTLHETQNGFAFSSVLEDKEGNIWFGTWNDGVYRYDARGVSLDPSTAHLRNDQYFITRFSCTDMLSKSAILTIYQDKTGKIWFGTDTNDSTFRGHGVFCFDPSASHAGSWHVSQFTTKDGLCNKSPFSNNIISSINEDNAGRIWFGGDGGVSYYDGSSFTTVSKKEGVYDDHVGFILKDRSGKMWFGTWNLGLYCYDGGKIRNFTERQ
jgi:ligand-binding sensor domain-containing protein